MSTCNHTRAASALRGDECAECLREQVKRLSATVRELRDNARGLCEEAQETRGIRFERLYNCVWAVEQSEEVLPSQGLSTTMLSTKDLIERNRTRTT